MARKANSERLESSLQDISARIDETGQFDEPLIQNEEVLTLQNDAQHSVADAAANLMTGLHLRSEQREYMRAYGVYRRLLGTVALDLAEQSLQAGYDTGRTKREVFGYLQQSKRQMVALDYQKRLEKSRLERSKQWLAHHRKTRFAGTLAMSGATSSGLFMAGDQLTPMIEFSRTQSTGIVGVATLGGVILLRSLMRSGPTKAGAALSKQFNSTLKTYEVDKRKKRNGDIEQTLEDLPAKYAEKHLAIPFGAAAIYLTNYDLSQADPENPSEQLRDMINGTLDITEQSMFDSYGINSAKINRAPWYKRLTRSN